MPGTSKALIMEVLSYGRTAYLPLKINESLTAAAGNNSSLPWISAAATFKFPIWEPTEYPPEFILDINASGIYQAIIPQGGRNIGCLPLVRMCRTGYRRVLTVSLLNTPAPVKIVSQIMNHHTHYCHRYLFLQNYL